MSDRLSHDLASLRIEQPVPQARGAWGRVWSVGLLLVLGAATYLVAPHVVSTFTETDLEPTATIMPPSADAATDIGEIRIIAAGYVVAQVTSKVGAKVEGRIEQVFVREGDVVKKGDPLFALDAAKQATQVVAAEARLAAARARAEQHRVDLAETTRRLKREQRLLDQGAATRAEVEDLQGQAKVLRQTSNAARAEVAEARAQVDELVVDSELRIIRAPIDGIVVSNPADVGEAVAPILPALLDIADFSSLVVEVDVPETRLGKLEIGGPCTIVLDAHPDHQYEGAVAEISPVINRAKATVVARVRFVGAHAGVMPNMAARVSFLASPTRPPAPAKRQAPASSMTERATNEPRIQERMSAR
jgi:HlyD family secretion protein